MWNQRSAAEREHALQVEMCAQNPKFCYLSTSQYGSLTPQEPSYFGLTGLGIGVVIVILIFFLIIALAIRRAISKRRSKQKPQTNLEN